MFVSGSRSDNMADNTSASNIDSNDTNTNNINNNVDSSLSMDMENNYKNQSEYSIMNVLLKLLFYVCITLQVVLWPSVMTITFASAIALEALVRILLYFTSSSKNNNLVERLGRYDILIFGGGDVTVNKLLLIGLIGVYMLIFFLLFVSHEMRIQPAQTTWLDESVFGKYTFTDDQNQALPGVDVASTASFNMRSNPFQWPHSFQQAAVPINGTIFTTPAINCQSTKFSCYSAKLAAFNAPSILAYLPYYFVPFVSQFYTADVIISPPQGVSCTSLEVYRITLDDRGNLLHALDYPASADSSPITGNNGGTSSQGNTSSTLSSYTTCGLFGVSSSWCLAYVHSFTNSQYQTKMASKCAWGNNQQLTIRLPPRGWDVDAKTGRFGQDILLVTAGASVQMRWKWHNVGTSAPLLTSWEQWPTTYGDSVQAWREASDAASVYFKYFIAITPLLLVWYFLGVRFEQAIPNSQIALMCILVLLPSALLFLSVGAWLPMAGCIVCLVAINHPPANDPDEKSTAKFRMRHLLLFITATCNSIQLIWILVLIDNSGWTSFLYENTLKQLTDNTNQFIISGSPTWVGLLLPSLLLLNTAFLLGSAICVGMELMEAQPNVDIPSSGVNP